VPETTIRLSEDVLCEFVNMYENVRDWQFALGDKLNAQIKLHGGKKKPVINQVAGRLNVKAASLYDYANVSNKWSVAKRIEYQGIASWTIYRNTDPIKDKELLDKAIEFGWNATRLKEEKYPAIVKPENLVMQILGRCNKLLKCDVLSEAHIANTEYARYCFEMMLEELRKGANDENL